MIETVGATVGAQGMVDVGQPQVQQGKDIGYGNVGEVAG